MAIPIYYMQVKISYKQSNRVRGERQVWLVSIYDNIPEINQHKARWIAAHFWSGTKTKPDVLVTEIISKKEIGTTND
jgi:hypothetical protein